MAGSWVEESHLLCSADAETKNVLLEHAKQKKIPKGTVIFRPGDACTYFPIVVSGSIKVQRISENGKLFLLYNVSADQTCILTTAAMISNSHCSAEAIAETDVTAYLLHIEKFKSLLGCSERFRSMVFAGYSSRISSLMNKIEEIVCVPIHVRLANRLLEISAESDQINVTQQNLADDLASAREVVGRALKKFEEQGYIRQSRGKIEILDRKLLKQCDEIGA
jgi:CRP/FNR family transcriptional regulator, anaerobic regulatory protein